MVTPALVILWLNYCSAHYLGLHLKITLQLQLVKNAGALVVMGTLWFTQKHLCSMNCIGCHQASGQNPQQQSSSIYPFMIQGLCDFLSPVMYPVLQIQQSGHIQDPIVNIILFCRTLEVLPFYAHPCPVEQYLLPNSSQA